MARHAENQLINLLPRVERARLMAGSQAVDLTLTQVLCEPGEAATHVYFPTLAFISLITPLPGFTGLEVGMIGHEGMLGGHLALGVQTSPVRALVQGGGSARCMTATEFRRQLKGGAGLQRVMGRYLHVLMSQMAQSAACIRFHLIGPRLARWLLMTEDRARTPTFPVTQEFLALMLGVRRAGVSNAAGALQRAGLITYHRGDMTVVDRHGLEQAACSCYAADLQAYTGSMMPAAD